VRQAAGCAEKQNALKKDYYKKKTRTPENADLPGVRVFPESI